VDEVVELWSCRGWCSGLDGGRLRLFKIHAGCSFLTDTISVARPHPRAVPSEEIRLTDAEGCVNDRKKRPLIQ
jgi:hypothetical protein